jgi:hypothetical protein
MPAPSAAGPGEREDFASFPKLFAMAAKRAFRRGASSLLTAIEIITSPVGEFEFLIGDE